MAWKSLSMVPGLTWSYERLTCPSNWCVTPLPNVAEFTYSPTSEAVMAKEFTLMVRRLLAPLIRIQYPPILGCSSLCINGNIVGRTAQYGIEEVEVALATVDLEDVRSYRNSVRSRNVKAASAPSYPRVDVSGFALSDLGNDSVPSSKVIDWVYHSPEEEILLGPACWLWDYLRRSGQGGYLLPLSGGLDSASTATLVFSMCSLVIIMLSATNEARKAEFAKRV